jgi:hypothetical protein
MVEQCQTTPEKMLITECITRSLVWLDISKQSMWACTWKLFNLWLHPWFPIWSNEKHTQFISFVSKDNPLIYLDAKRGNLSMNELLFNSDEDPSTGEWEKHSTQKKNSDLINKTGAFHIMKYLMQNNRIIKMIHSRLEEHFMYIGA